MTATETKGIRVPKDGGRLIVLTAPLTEIIDHAGYFIQMSMASLPMWLEGILNKKYPKWRDVEYNDDGSARYMPAGVRVLEASLLRRLRGRRHRRAAIPTTSTSSSGRDTRIVAVSTHNPLGVTFAAGVYTSIFGSSKQPINSHYARQLFERDQVQSASRVASRSSSAAPAAGRSRRPIPTRSWASTASSKAAASRTTRSTLFDKAIAGEELPRRSTSATRMTRDAILVPGQAHDVRRRRDDDRLRPPLPVLRARPESADRSAEGQDHGAVRANVRDGNKQISLATEDMFIWGQVHTDTPFYFPNREALLDLLSRRRQYAGRRAARAQPRDDRAGGRRSGADRAALRELCSTRARFTCPCSARIRSRRRSCR